MIMWFILFPFLLIFFNYYLNIIYLKRFNMIGYILLLYLSLLLLLLFNHNSFEYSDVKSGGIIIGIDGVGLSLIILLNILMPIIIWIIPDIKILNKINFLYIILILILLSLDLFSFFIFFELLLIPMFLLIGIYGSPSKRIEASYRFIIYTYAGSILMLISIIIIYLLNGSSNLEYLIYSRNNNPLYSIIALLFIISLLIKLPIFPFHIWLPIVHVESPTIGSMLLAGILLKIATFGIYRYSIPIFSSFLSAFSLFFFVLILLSVFYVSFLNIRQIDLKKIIAYSSIIHMNFTLFGLISNDINGIYGALFSNISHGIVSSLLFYLIGILYVRYHSRILYYYNNLANLLPLFSVVLFISILHNIAIPTSSSFVSELYILISSFKINIIFSIFLFFSLLFSTIYNIWLLNRLLFNQNSYLSKSIDLSLNEFLICISLISISLILGLFPSPLLSLFSPSLIPLLY